MLFPTNAFPTTIATLATWLVPFVITYVAISSRDKLKSTPLQKPLPQYFFPSTYEELCIGLLMMPDWMRSPLFKLYFLELTSYLGPGTGDHWTIIYNPFTLQPCNLLFLSRSLFPLWDSNYWTSWYKKHSTNHYLFPQYPSL